MIRAMSFAAGAVAIVAASAVVLSGNERDAHNQTWLTSTAQGALNLETNLKTMLAEDRGRRSRLDYAIAQATERDRICRPGFSATIRLDHHSAEYKRLRDAAFAQARIPVSSQCHKDDLRLDCYILDHICPLELDCPSTLDNLQVQHRAIAAAKDRIENETRRAYCAGKLTLEEARARFRMDR